MLWLIKYVFLQEEDEKQPTSNTTKEKIQTWLTKQGIAFGKDMLRKELLALARLHKKRKNYILEGLLMGTEHEILRLPPYHACFNPIELAWGLVKRYFDAHVGRNQDYSNEMMIQIFQEALDTVTPEVWSNICDKVEKKIKEAWELEIQRDEEDFQMIIKVGGDSDDEDDEEEDGEWQTIKKSVHFDLAEEQEVDDPDVAEEMVRLEAVLNQKLSPRKKLTQGMQVHFSSLIVTCSDTVLKWLHLFLNFESAVELACGISFDEVLPKTKTQKIPKRTRRSLFGHDIKSVSTLRLKYRLFLLNNWLSLVTLYFSIKQKVPSSRKNAAFSQDMLRNGCDEYSVELPVNHLSSTHVNTDSKQLKGPTPSLVKDTQFSMVECPVSFITS